MFYFLISGLYGFNFNFSIFTYNLSAYYSKLYFIAFLFVLYSNLDYLESFLGICYLLRYVFNTISDEFLIPSIYFTSIDF